MQIHWDMNSGCLQNLIPDKVMCTVRRKLDWLLVHISAQRLHSADEMSLVKENLYVRVG